MASPTIGSCKWGEIKYAAPIIPILRKIGAAAGAAKCLKELRTPMKKATILIKNIYGKVILVKSTVRSYFTPEPPKPKACILTIHGEKITPSNVTSVRINIRSVNIILARSNAFSLLFVARYSENTGIKEMVRDPSANRRLKRFGILNATKKASVTIPEPNRLAMTISRTKPNIRLKKVKNPTTPAALFRLFSSDPGKSGPYHRLGAFFMINCHSVPPSFSAFNFVTENFKTLQTMIKRIIG
jgi:hypothetical protein